MVLTLFAVMRYPKFPYYTVKNMAETKKAWLLLKQLYKHRVRKCHITINCPCIYTYIYTYPCPCICMNSNVRIIMQSVHYTYSSQKSHREHTLITGYHSYFLNIGLDKAILISRKCLSFGEKAILLQAN